MLKIDPTAKISPLADIEDSTRGTLIEIGARTFINFGAVIFHPLYGPDWSSFQTK